MTASESFKAREGLSQSPALCAIFLSVKVVGHGTTHKRSFEAYEEFSLVKLNEVWWLKFDLYLFCILLWDLCYKYMYVYNMYTFWYYKFISIVLDNTIAPVFPFVGTWLGSETVASAEGSTSTGTETWASSASAASCWDRMASQAIHRPKSWMTWNGQNEVSRR